MDYWLFNAELKPGTELLLKAIDFSEKIKGADLIITGEGKADRQTAMGKVPYGILKEAQKEHIPVIVLAGSIENLPELNKAGFKGIFSIAPAPSPWRRQWNRSLLKKISPGWFPNSIQL